MPRNLRRITGFGDLHFVTLCCYHRRALLASAITRNLVIHILDDVRRHYHFALVGYHYQTLLRSDNGRRLTPKDTSWVAYAFGV